MTLFESGSPAKALTTAAVLAANPKNLAFVLAASATISASDATDAEHLVTAVAFALVASAGALVPVAAYVVLGTRADPSLARIKEWLLRNNAGMMGAILVLLGANLVGNGIAVLF